MNDIVESIKSIRKRKGYSHENMALEMNISQVAYSKIEKGITKLTIERLYKIAEILEVEIGELLGIQSDSQFNQINKDNATGYLQQIENFHQENKEQNEKIISLYEERLEDKDIVIAELKGLIAALKSK